MPKHLDFGTRLKSIGGVVSFTGATAHDRIVADDRGGIWKWARLISLSIQILNNRQGHQSADETGPHFLKLSIHGLAHTYRGGDKRGRYLAE